jgi:hypothetical protein
MDGFPIKKGETATHRPGGFLPVYASRQDRAEHQERTFRKPTPTQSSSNKTRSPPLAAILDLLLQR